MAICKPTLFGNTSQYIKVGNGEFVAIEGSSTFDRLLVSDARMPYKQLLKGRVMLKVGQVNYLLNHLGLGDNATFLAIKASYNSKSVIEADNYVTYNYYDQPVTNFHFAQMLVLTGNSTNRIPQLYLTNPSQKYPVILDIMVGIIDDNYSFFNDVLNQTGSTFTGLEYTDIKSFIVGESIVINDKNIPPKPLIYFGLAYINSIALNGKFLIVDDESQGTIYLNFLTEYDAAQAHSLLNFVLENPNIDISSLSPPFDAVSPIVFWNSTAGTGGSYIQFNGATSGVPYDTTDGFTFSTTISKSIWGSFSGVSGATATLYKSQLRDLLIDAISDNRDGTMSMQDSEMIITTGTSSEVESITATGSYTLTFNFEDIAQNDLGGVNMSLNITD